MALIGISVRETFEYVLDRDPCKKTVEVPADPADPSQGKRTDSLVSDHVVLLFSRSHRSRA
jgi:hypothetical protein